MQYLHNFTGSPKQPYGKYHYSSFTENMSSKKLRDAHRYSNRTRLNTSFNPKATLSIHYLK